MPYFQNFTHEGLSDNLKSIKEASLSSTILTQADIPAMMDLQETVLASLPSHKQHFIAKRTKEEFLKFIQTEGVVVGLKKDDELVAYSIAHFPKDVISGGFDPKISIENIEKSVFLKSTLVHPNYRGLSLQKTLIDTRLEQATLAGKKWAICEVDIQNAASIKNLLAKGFTIRDCGRSPADFMPAVYMYKDLEATPELPNNNSLQLVPVEDWGKHQALLKAGHTGVDYFDGFITYKHNA